ICVKSAKAMIRLDGRTSRVARSGSLPLLTTASFPQHEILHDRFAFAGWQRCAAGSAGYVAINGLWTGFDFDDLIKSITVRAIE
ncbi:MAG: hypothetical protein ACLQFW_19910, partial [Xanthobacteraceae bacterium]